MKRQVAYAHVWYYDEQGTQRTAVRAQFVELPEAEEKRLDEMGALVPKGGQLQTLGELVPLDESASGEKIASYLISGNSSEISEQLPRYSPSLIEKLYVAEKGGEAREDVLAVLKAHADGAVVNIPTEVVGLEETATDDQIRNFLDASSAKEVTAAVEGKSSDFITRVFEIESERPDPRSTLLSSLSKAQESADKPE